MTAIVLDGNLKSALAVVRSLGKAGIRVSVGSERSTGMALHSRYTRARFVYPSPYIEQRAFIDTLKTEILRIGGKPVLYALSDATYLTLYAYREELAPIATIVFPESQSVELAFDKGATYSLARVSGVPTITTHAPTSVLEAERIAKEVVYPAIMKPSKSVTWGREGGRFGSAVFIHSATELVNVYKQHVEYFGETPLIQECLFGEEYGVEMLAHEGAIYARVTHHRLTSLSPTGGASVLKETLMQGNLKQTLEEYAVTLVQKLSWTGPIMVEFKVDRDSREPYLMEINGRFWGSLPLSIFSGVDMPLLFFNAMHNEDIPKECIEGREGVVSNHFLGSVYHLSRVLFARDRMRTILYPTRRNAVRAFFRKPAGTMSDVWSFSDPVPAVMELVDAFMRFRK